jgi:hypothetical protein
MVEELEPALEEPNPDDAHRGRGIWSPICLLKMLVETNSVDCSVIADSLSSFVR